jgi:hypothetical protein
MSGSYGLVAEFHSPREIVLAARQAHQAGFRRLDAYTPYPIEELSEALELSRSPLPLMVLAAGIAGALGGYALEYLTSVVIYPLNIGGRPLHSWPAFIVPAFETTILCAAGAAVVGMLALNRLPEPYHPVFNVPEFAMASRDAFFLCIEASDPRFDPVETRAFLEALPGSPKVSEVAP